MTEKRNNSNLPYNITEAETEVRRIVKRGFLSGRTQEFVMGEVNALIDGLLHKIPIKTLRSDTARSLRAFAFRQYDTYKRNFGTGAILLMLAALGTNNTPPQGVEAAHRLIRATPRLPPVIGVRSMGVPLQTYYKTVYEEQVLPVLNQLAEQQALDPNDQRHRNSLRNLAEMEVRYRANRDSIAALKAAGVVLVIASAHADCSDRCAPYQGRVYSLNGTGGTTTDGREFVPLETATDVYYTTRAGRTYKNGLLGFNCRHYLTPYRAGMAVPYLSEEQRTREQAITKRQRELERRVRRYRAQAAQFEETDRKRYLRARKNAIAANREYQEFSKRNRRAYYPDRVKI